MEKYLIHKANDHASVFHYYSSKYECKQTTCVDDADIFYSKEDAEKFIQGDEWLVNNYKVCNYKPFVFHVGNRVEVKTEDLDNLESDFCFFQKYSTKIKDNVEWTILRQAPYLRQGEHECPHCFRAISGSQYCNETCHSNR